MSVHMLLPLDCLTQLGMPRARIGGKIVAEAPLEGHCRDRSWRDRRGFPGFRARGPAASSLILSPAAAADAFTAALGRLSAAGATIADLPMAEFTQAAAVNPRGALTSAEAYWWHRQWLKDGADKYDPRVLVRIRAGETITAASYIDLIKLREQFIRTINAAAAGYDAMLMPTTLETAPTIAEAGKDDETYTRLNLRMLRNAAIVNLFDGCALSIPCHVTRHRTSRHDDRRDARHRPKHPGGRSRGGRRRLEAARLNLMGWINSGKSVRLCGGACPFLCTPRPTNGGNEWQLSTALN
jgi:hypothetical protein